MARIIYGNEKVVEENDLDLTLLEISLKHNIPHVHTCGGKARCSTCRVIILESEENVLPRNEKEHVISSRKGFADNIRLACQTKVCGSVKIRRLVLDEYDIKLSVSDSKFTGREKNIVVMFCDIREFTKFSENNLSYDIVHIINRYFFHMGEIILKHNGYIDKYMGDGIMAIFGIEDESSQSCLDAVECGLEMVRDMDDFNDYLRNNFNTEFRIGIGIHYGEAIIGQMGHPENSQFSAIGDTVNIASRVESSTKISDVPMLISDALYNEIKDRTKIGKSVECELKGKVGTHDLFEVLEIF